MSRFAILSSKPNQLIPFSPPLSSQYAAYYYPWMNITNPLTNSSMLIPPGGHVAGIYARSDDARGVQKDPANEVIQGIDSLQFILTDAQQALLNPVGINVLRYFKGTGNLVWGGRTISADPDWKYINVRRLFIFIEQSILQSTRWAVFEINDEPVWAQVRRSISDFLTRLWMDDMLQGATMDQAFFVRCDRTTMTQYDIDNGRLICVIGVAPVKPAEFVIFQIGQWAGGGSVSE
jgi:phage tail sheath protein FI